MAQEDVVKGQTEAVSENGWDGAKLKTQRERIYVRFGGMIGFEDDLVVVFPFNEQRSCDLGEGSGLLYLVMNTWNFNHELG